jgi:GNAT superfamily N-acetyltransferase
MEIRHLHPDEMAEAIALTNLVFRSGDPEKKSFAESHPLVFSPALNQSFGGFLDGKLVSFIGVVPSVVRIGPARVTCLSIGGVCTHPEYRGQGFADRLLQAVLAHAEQAGAALLLVSGDRSLYARANCFPYGSFRRYTVDRRLADSIIRRGGRNDPPIREYAPADLLKLQAVAAERFCAFQQSVWDLALLIRAESMGTVTKHAYRVLVAEQDKTFAGFAVIGVPYPQTAGEPFVCEWAGDGRTAASLFAHAVVRYKLDRLSVHAAPHEQALAQALAPTEPECVRNGGTIRVVSPERLLRQLAPYLERIDAETASRLQFAGTPSGEVVVSLSGMRERIDPRAFNSLLFDVSPLVPADREPFRSLRGLFPIPFPYAYGLNYI